MEQQVLSPTSLSRFTYEGSRDILGANRARSEAKRAIFYLLATSHDAAILVAREWRVVQGDYMFEHMSIYEDVAAKGGCCVARVAREEAGGCEHLLFLARRPGMSESELLTFVGPSNLKPAGAHSRWA